MTSRHSLHSSGRRLRTATAILATTALIVILFSMGRTPEPSVFERIAQPPANKFVQKQRTAVGRAEYETTRLKDPRTGTIPTNIRSRELAFAREMAQEARFSAKNAGSIVYEKNWEATGPHNVGGRTRALAFDLDYNGTSNRRILAGGVSGGMFLSEDGGESWTLTTALDAIASVTALVQDPTNRNVWYHGTGEWYGSSAAGGGNHSHWGHGLFKSTDGGASWSQLDATIIDNRVDQFDDNFDIVWRLVVDDSGTVFAATRAGIYRSTDGGESWEFILAGADGSTEAIVTDLALSPSGPLFAAMSRNGGSHQSGVFVSEDGGDSWLDFTPPNLAADTYRMQLAVSESDPTTVYLLSQTTEGGGVTSEHQLLRLNTSTLVWTDLNLTGSLPEEEDEGGLNSQGGYDLVLAVKPDDPETIWVGGTNLLRSTNGGQTFEVVGGLLTSGEDAGEDYENHFPDQHAIDFQPGNPNVMLSGNDGGVYITQNALESPQSWTDLNNGYITSQFYSLAIVPDVRFDERMVGGMQDNGNYLRQEGTAADGDWQAIEFNGDGAISAFASEGSPYYVSLQHGTVIRVDDLATEAVALVQPLGFVEDDFLFVTPYVLDPNNTNVMYMAVFSGILRNSDLTAIPNQNEEPTFVNWTALEQSALDGSQQTTALAVSTFPADRLYFAGSDMESVTTVVRVDDPVNDGPGLDITPPGLEQGAYVSDIGVNPWNGDELIVVVSNYNTASLFHSTDGGATWTDVEGNLAGEGGPSIRDAEILPTLSSQVYFLATSTGIYATTGLDGSQTQWTQQATDLIGNVVVDDIAVRDLDGFIAVGSHGRGTFAAYVDRFGTSDDDEGTSREEDVTVPQAVQLDQNYPNPFNPSTTIQYQLATPGSVRIQVFDMQGRVVDVLEQGFQSRGTHNVTWEGVSGSGTPVASGTYLYRLSFADEAGAVLHTETRQMTLIK